MFQREMSPLKALLANMALNVVALPTFQLEISPLKRELANMLSKLVALETSHCEMSPLNLELANTFLNVATWDTSMWFKSQRGPYCCMAEFTNLRRWAWSVACTGMGGGRGMAPLYHAAFGHGGPHLLRGEQQ